MNLKRNGALVGLLAVGAMSVAACGSDNNAGGGAASPAAAAAADCAGKSTLSAAGSSAQKNAMDSFTAAYITACSGKNVAYNASGSGDGRTQFIAGQIDFAGSDSAIKGDQLAQAKTRCAGNDVWNIPLVFGPVALAYKIDGVDNLTLTGEVTAKIFNGGIKKWNDPAIAALNSGVSLPDEDINVVVRSDSSGTTDNFQQYLTAASKGAWTQGAGSDFVGGVGNGSKGSAGVAQAIAGASGSIGYVEKSYADQNSLSAARIDNGSGPVALTNETATKAIEATKFAAEGNKDLTLDLKSIYSTTAAETYPLILTTYEIVCSKGYDAETAAAVKGFLTLAANAGQADLAEEGYIPLPESVKSKVLASIGAIA